MFSYSIISCCGTFDIVQRCNADKSHPLGCIRSSSTSQPMSTSPNANVHLPWSSRLSQRRAWPETKLAPHYTSMACLSDRNSTAFHPSVSAEDSDPRPHVTVRLTNNELRQTNEWYTLHWRLKDQGLRWFSHDEITRRLLRLFHGRATAIVALVVIALCCHEKESRVVTCLRGIRHFAVMRSHLSGAQKIRSGALISPASSVILLSGSAHICARQMEDP